MNLACYILLYTYPGNIIYSSTCAYLFIPSFTGFYGSIFNISLLFILFIFSSLVIFFVPYGTFINGTDSSGKDMNDYSILALTVFRFALPFLVVFNLSDFSSLIVAVTGQICNFNFKKAITPISKGVNN